MSLGCGLRPAPLQFTPIPGASNSSDDLASLRAQEQVPDASCTKGFKDLMLEVAKTGTLGEMLAVLLAPGIPVAHFRGEVAVKHLF